MRRPSRPFRGQGELSTDADVAVMISCQWELLAQPLPDRGDELYVIGQPAFDRYVRLRFEDVANRLRDAGVDRILWMTCPYLSSSVGVDGLATRFRDSRDPVRVDRLNAIITAIADGRPDVDALTFSAWMNDHVDDAAIRPDGSHYDYRSPNPAADAFVASVNAALCVDPVVRSIDRSLRFGSSWVERLPPASITDARQQAAQSRRRREPAAATAPAPRRQRSATRLPRPALRS